MTSLGEYCSAGTIRCNKIIATEADLPSSGGGGGGDIDVDSITFDNKWKIYLDANSNFILENEAQNIISLSGDAHTGKITLHDFDINDLANLDTTRSLNFTGDDLKIQSSNNSNIFVGGSNRTNPTIDGASIGIGYLACDASNRSYNIGIGFRAGRLEQGIGFPFQGQSISIGYESGESFQKVHAISLGAYSGKINQGESSLACGFFSGNDRMGDYAVALGNACGQTAIGNFAVALGASSGNINQGIESLACGSFSGHKNLGYQSVALGHRASFDGGDFSNTIVINATGSDLDPEGTDRTYIKPIREQLNNEFLFYNNISGEVSRSAAVDFTSNIFINGDRGNENDVLTSQGTLGTPIWRAVTLPIPIFGSFDILGNAFPLSPINQNVIITALKEQTGVVANGMSVDSTNGEITLTTAGTYLVNAGFMLKQRSSGNTLDQMRINLVDSGNVVIKTIAKFQTYGPTAGGAYFRFTTLSGHVVLVAPTNNYIIKVQAFANAVDCQVENGTDSQGIAIQKLF